MCGKFWWWVMLLCILAILHNLSTEAVSVAAAASETGLEDVSIAAAINTAGIKPLPRLVVGCNGGRNKHMPFEQADTFGGRPAGATVGPCFATASGETVVLRGANYIRLNGTQGIQPTQPVYHSTFSPRLFNRTEAAIALKQLATSGYNVVRVFIDTGAPGRSDGVVDLSRHHRCSTESSTTTVTTIMNNTNRTLSSAYLNAFAAFVTEATVAGVYVIPTLYGLPASPGYNCGSSRSGYPNSLLLESDCINAKAEYVTRLLTGLRTRVGPLVSTVGIISIANEVTYSVASKPFSQSGPTAGKFRGPDGLEYDLASMDARQALADVGLDYWSVAAASAARKAVPGLLVMVGMFSFQAVGKDHKTWHGLPPPTDPAHRIDPRVPPRPSVFIVRNGSSSSGSGSSSSSSSSSGIGGGNVRISGGVDVIDFHVYQVPLSNGQTWSLGADLDSSDWASLRAVATAANVPLLMGEFGAWRKSPDLFPDATAAASAMVKQQIASCTFGFMGWLFWTQDTWEQPRLWNFVSAPEIEAALAPNNRSQACKA